MTMEFARNEHKTKKHLYPHQVAVKQAYKPKKPFWTIEGVGSEAWKRLDFGAVGLLMKFYEKFNGYNRANLSVTYREVKNKVSSLVFTRWIWQLIGYGFLDVKRQGRLERKCSLYGLSDRWRRLSEQPKKLDEIEELLAKIEKLKRQRARPGKLDEIRALRHQIINI